MTLEAIKYNRGHLSILDQLLLPLETKYIDIENVQGGWDAIHQMKVRGAPAIAIVGCLSLAVELNKTNFSSKLDLSTFVTNQMNHLITARKTAVNIKRAADQFTEMGQLLVNDQEITLESMKERILLALEDMLVADVKINKAIGLHGANHILEHCGDRPIRILTHCNTGSLATAGYGTALGVIRTLHSLGHLGHTYFTETRPYNQGARLTGYELVHEGIPSTLICDDMVGWLMKVQDVSAVIVGADRVVANGDTANKIGTYQLAILAKYHNIPFYVAAPTTTIDQSQANGDSIPIEERASEELTHIQGMRIAAPGTECWNPAFDVTPAELITGGIVTEHGVYKPDHITRIKET